jgi:hypothetical protein
MAKPCVRLKGVVPKTCHYVLCRQKGKCMESPEEVKRLIRDMHTCAPARDPSPLLKKGRKK